jgi:hypothetical protein
MQQTFESLMTSKSEEQLNEYLININRYTPEAVNAAIAELRSRGREFTDDELDAFNQAILLKEKKEAERISFTTNQWKKNIVDDPDAPAYYSQQAIWGFSTFFTVIFGAVLMSYNLKGNRQAQYIILGFGVLYTVASIWILSMIPRSPGFTLAVNGIGGWLMTSFFWHKYLGKERKYRTKPIWKPLIISIVIMIPFLLAVIFTAEN